VKKCLMVYFSQHGSTLRVAKRIADGLRSAGCQVDMYRLGDPLCPNPLEYDMLGIGFPVYYFRPPLHVQDYLAQLPELKGLPVFVFVLYGTYYGDAFHAARNVLAHKGAGDAGGFVCRGKDLFLGYLREGYLFSPQSPLDEELTDAEAFGRECADHFNGAKTMRTVARFSVGWVYRLEQIMVSRWLINNVYSRLFTVNSKCNHCGLCSKLCPTRNILAAKNRRPQFARNCLLCLTCELRCPQGAITSPVSWPAFALFMRYNTRKAARDPHIQYVPAKHEKGKTIYPDMP
jgi:flavodoxin/Pyruvate/2-oxoacid:ferredoxin oxidoreductase delta subunit